MNDSTTLPAVRGADLPAASAALDAAVAAAIEAAPSPDTRRMYRAQARVFGSWRDANGLAALPATPETVARYLTARAEAGAAVATVHAARSAIAAMHRAAAVANPCRSEIVRVTVRGLTRQHRAPQRQAPPLTADGLAAIFATAHLPRPRARGGKGLETPAVAARRAAVDRAIAALLFQGALRRSEVAALTWADVEPGTAEGTCLVRVRAGKTNQDGRRADVRLLKGSCAGAVESLRPRHAAGSARVIGLDPRTIGRRLTAAARFAGLEGTFTGHSGRIGLASELTARGASLQEVMLAGGWASSAMVARYSAGATVENGAVMKYF